MTPVGTSVLLVDADASRADETRDLLIEQGYAIAGVLGGLDGLAAALAKSPVDTVIIQAPQVDEALLAGLRAVPDSLRKPTVLFSEDGAAEVIHAAVAAGVNAYVVVGVNGNRVRSAVNLAVANFSNTNGLREELDEARAALRDRKIIERAKGLVMKQKGIDEAEAYDLLRRRAMQKGMRLVDVATMVNEAAEVMAG